MDKRVPTKQTSNAPVFRGSLVRMVVLTMLALTTLPVAGIGIVNYFRSQAMYKSQATDQIQLVVDNYSEDIQIKSTTAQMVMNGLMGNKSLFHYIDLMLTNPTDGTVHTQSKNEVILYMRSVLDTLNGRIFSEISLLDDTGKVIISTNEKREGTSYTSGRGPAQLLGKHGTAAVFSPTPLFSQGMVIFSARPYSSEATGGKTYTIMAAGQDNVFEQVLVESAKFYPDAQAFLFNQENQTVGLTSDQRVIQYSNLQAQIKTLHALIDGQVHAGPAEYVSWSNENMIAYARWLPDMNIGLVIEAPSDVLAAQVRAQNNMNLIIMGLSLLIITAVIWFASRRMVRPLVELTGNVQAFSGGEWGRRTQVTRRDEIGLLAHTFNQMADELSQLYRSLEQKVEERNKQMHMAAEVSQYAAASLNRQEILQRTVDLIAERFGYGYASIYLLDSTRAFFTTQASSGVLATETIGSNIGGRIRAQSVFGKAINANEIQVIDNRLDADANESLLPGAQSEVVVPISIGSEVVGVLDIQNATENTFGADTTTALRMVAGQVASGLNNIAQVENAQVDLKETSLLYRASRQISQAQAHETIWTTLEETLRETSYLGMVLQTRPQDDQLRATNIIETEAKKSGQPTIIVTLSRVVEKLHQGGYQIFDALAQPSEFYPILSYFHQRGCSKAALIPVYVGGELSQVVALATRGESRLTPATMQQYLSLAEVIANAQERLNALELMEGSLSELRALASVSHAISLETDVEALYPVLLEQVKAVVGGEFSFFIALYERETSQIHFPFTYENGQVQTINPIQLGEGLTSHVIKTQKPLLLERNAMQQMAALGIKLVGTATQSWLGVPLSVGGEVFGVMVAQDTEADGRFGQKELRLFTTLAPQVAVTIRNAQLLSQMQGALKAYDQEHFLLNMLLDNVPDRISFKDEQARYLLCSQSVLAFHGNSVEEEIVGKTISELRSGEAAAEKIYALEMDLLRSGEPVLNEVIEMPNAQGSQSWITLDILPMHNEEGKINGLLSIAHDITELKRTEQVAQIRAQQLQTASEIARDTSGTLNVEELLSNAINMVRDRFGFYHASIFLLDALGDYAVLRESTGEAGAQLKAAGHRLAVGSSSIVGTATSSGDPVVVDDVTLSANYYANPLLPLTRAELAMPLRMGTRVIGVLDVQSTEPNAFQPEDIQILGILADQLAIAISNADLFVDTQDNITKHRFLHQISTAAAGSTSEDDALRTTVEGLQTAFGSDHVAIYLFDDRNTLYLRASAGYVNVDTSQVRATLGQGTIGLAALGQHPVMVKDAQMDEQSDDLETGIRSQLAVPIMYTDRTIGVMSIGSSQPAAYDENDQEILGSLGSTLGAILANTQLVSQIRQQVEQQKQLFEISSKIRRSSDIQTILQVSTRELANVLHARRAQIRLMAEQAAGPELENYVPEKNTGPGFGAFPGDNGQNGNGQNGNGHNGNGHNGNGHHHQELDL